MTVSQDTFFGRSRFSNSTTEVFGPEDTLLRVQVVSTGTVTFNYDYTRHAWDLVKTGRPLGYVLNVSTGQNVLVRGNDNTLLVTLLPDEYAIVYLKSTNATTNTQTYHISKGRLHTHASFVGMRTLSNRSAAITNVTVDPPFSPFCFREDECALAKAEGQTPLNGEGGDAEVVAPMYQDVTIHAKNYDREAIRAADVIMPKIIPVRFNKDEFAEDTNHPLSASVNLIDEFFETLYQAVGEEGSFQDEPHLLTYNAALSGASRTRHWNHLEYTGTWDHGTGLADLTARKHVWQRLVQYGPPDDPDAHTLDIRLIMEHTFGSEVLADCTAGGPSYTTENGAWGALFTLCVFTNEILPSFVDDSTTFQAVGDTLARTYRRADPAVSGQSFGVAVTNGEQLKFVHPQCVILAQVPTTFQAPIGRNKVPLVNFENFKIEEGGNTGLSRNLERCYDVPNGCPFLSGACSDTFPCVASGTFPDSIHGIIYNCVFGHHNSEMDQLGKAMTLGGDMARSKPMEWLAFENGAGVGRTFLVPTNPGWDEACGKLDVIGGSSGIIRFCVDDGDCQDGDTKCGGPDANEWPVCKASPCDGHEQEPFENVGGSHTCFRNDNLAQGPGGPENTNCCVSIQDTTLGHWAFCARVTVVYGDPRPGFSDCEIVELRTDNSTEFFTTTIMFMNDYTYLATGNQTMRRMDWARLLPNPSKPNRVSVAIDVPGDFTQVKGTWTIGSTFSVTAVGATPGVTSLVRYDENSTDDWFGCEMEVELEGLTNLGIYGIGMFEDANNGIGMTVQTVGGGFELKIVRYISGTRVELASTTGTGNDNTGIAKFRIQGTDITAEYRPSGQPSFTSTTAEDGRLYGIIDQPELLIPENSSTSDFLPSLFTEGSALSQVFDPTGISGNFIEEIVPQFVSHIASITRTSVSVTVKNELTEGFGLCTESFNPNCGTCCEPAVCNCLQWDESLTTTLVSSHNPVSHRDIDSFETFIDCQGIDNNTDESLTADNPTYNGGPNPFRFRCEGTICNSGFPPCTDANPPSGRRSISFPLPLSDECWDKVDSGCLGNIPLMCYGIDHYEAGLIACE